MTYRFWKGYSVRSYGPYVYHVRGPRGGIYMVYESETSLECRCPRRLMGGWCPHCEAVRHFQNEVGSEQSFVGGGV